MRTLYLFLLLSLCLIVTNTTTLVAQQRVIERTFDLGSGAKVELDLKFGDIIRVRAWPRKEMSFRATVSINGDRLNEALLMDFQQTARGIKAVSDFDRELIKQGREMDCPEQRDGSSTSTFHYDRSDGHTICSNITYEIMVPIDADLWVESISSDIELRELEGPLHAKSISGFVDLSWPDGKGASLQMKTISGEIYSGLSNLTLNNRRDHAPPVGYELQGTIGEGGPLLSLSSISGNIYLRKPNK